MFSTSGCCGCLIYDLDFSAGGNWSDYLTVLSGSVTQLAESISLSPGTRLRLQVISRIPFFLQLGTVPLTETEQTTSLAYRFEITEVGLPDGPHETAIKSYHDVSLAGFGIPYHTNGVFLTLSVDADQYWIGSYDIGYFPGPTPSPQQIDEIITSPRTPGAAVSIVIQNDHDDVLIIEHLWAKKAQVDTDSCPQQYVICAVTADADYTRWHSLEATTPTIGFRSNDLGRNDNCEMQSYVDIHGCQVYGLGVCATEGMLNLLTFVQTFATDDPTQLLVRVTVWYYDGYGSTPFHAIPISWAKEFPKPDAWADYPVVIFNDSDAETEVPSALANSSITLRP